MLLFAIALLCIGGFVALLSGIWVLALAFQRHTYWGLAVLLVPLGGVAFSVARWREARAPFCMGLFSLSLFLTALLAMPQESVRLPLSRVLASLHHGAQALPSQAEAKMEQERQDAERQLRLLSLKRQEDVLQQRKAMLAPQQVEEAQTLSQEIRRYNAEVQAILPHEQARHLVSR